MRNYPFFLCVCCLSPSLEYNPQVSTDPVHLGHHFVPSTQIRAWHLEGTQEKSGFMNTFRPVPSAPGHVLDNRMTQTQSWYFEAWSLVKLSIHLSSSPSLHPSLLLSILPAIYSPTSLSFFPSLSPSLLSSLLPSLSPFLPPSFPSFLSSIHPFFQTCLPVFSICLPISPIIWQRKTHIQSFWEKRTFLSNKVL